MDKISSNDGTRIACWASGSGPPLLLVHGAMADHTRWSEVNAPLEAHFTVYAIDRRGRGESTDAPDYAMDREVEDLVAVVDFIGKPTIVLGHSYGADLALEAALRSDLIERLVLYEPGILEGVRGFYNSESIASSLSKVEDLLSNGQTEAAMVTLMREIIEMSDDDIDALKSMPVWPARVAAAHTMPRELRAEGDWIFDPDRYRDLDLPTLLLTGSESAEIAREGTAALHDALSNGRVVVLEGQGHGAITTAPDLFVREVLAFLTDA